MSSAALTCLFGVISREGDGVSCTGFSATEGVACVRTGAPTVRQQGSVAGPTPVESNCEEVCAGARPP